MTTNLQGTLSYMAPEAKMGSHVPYKSDMYSLGVILHFMLTKEFPHYVKNVKTGKFDIPSIYSQQIINLLTWLLKDNYQERPDIKDLLLLEVVIMDIQSYISIVNYQQNQQNNKVTIPQNKSEDVKKEMTPL